MDRIEFKNITDTSADFYVYGDITDNSDWKWDESDVMPQDIQNLLDTNKGKTLNIYVNSGGGSVFAGLSIYNMLKRFDGTKNVHVDGLAGSIASVIALAGDTVTIPKNAFMMIHKPWSMTAGNSDDMRKMAETLDRIQAGIMQVYQENISEGVDMATIEDYVNKETWLTGSQASQLFKNVQTGDEIQAVACTSNLFKNYSKVPKEILSPKMAQPTPEPAPAEPDESEESTGAPFFDVGDQVKIKIPHQDGHVSGVIREANLTYAYGVLIDGLEDQGIYHWYVESEIDIHDIEEDDDETETPEEEKQEQQNEIENLSMDLDLL